MAHYIIVGKQFDTLKQKIQERGDSYTLLQDVTATKTPDKKLKNRVLADFSSREALMRTVHSLPGTYDGAVVTYENYVLPTSWICEELGIPGMPTAAAEACTDKYIMRGLFAVAPEKISPDFAEVASLADAIAFAEAHTFPIILKPANLAKSLLVTKNEDMDELRNNYQKTVDHIAAVYQKYATHRQPKIIIEEFMSGSIHSVEAFVDNDGNPHVLEQVVDYQTGYDIGYQDNFHYSRVLPSTLSAGDQERLRHVAALGIRSLGMRSSPAHIEIIMTATGPQIVEIGARNGGYRERMHGLANGIDILGAALDLAAGKQPFIEAVRSDSCAVLELFPKSPGTYAGLRNEDRLRQLPSLKYLSVKAKPGQYVGKSADGYKMCAIIIIHSHDDRQFKDDLDFINTNVSVQTV